MRIAIISHPLHAGGGVSVGRNLIASITKLAPHNEYFISYPSCLDYEACFAGLRKMQLLAYDGRSSLLKRLAFEEQQLKPKLHKFNPDLILALANRGIGGFDCPEAILCHNSYLWYPSEHYGVRTFGNSAMGKLRHLIQRHQLQYSLSYRKNILLYQTTTARERIASRFKVEARAVHCPNAVSKYLSHNSPNSTAPLLLQHHREKFKLFYLTRYYPHKNLEAIVEMLRHHPEELNDIVVFITIDARQHPGADKLIKTIDQLGLKKQIINVGPLSQNELFGWFANCDALLMPTLLESFSGTYLEAMHFGLPILTSDLDFAREICGEAALYFDPWNTSSMRDAIQKIKNTPDHAHELRAKGRARLDRMQRSWDEIAINVLGELDKLVQSSD